MAIHNKSPFELIYSQTLTTYLFEFLVVLVLCLLLVMNGKSSSLVLIFAVSLAMVYPKRDLPVIISWPIAFVVLVEDSLTSTSSLKNSSSILSLAYGLPVLDPMAPQTLEPPTDPNLHCFTEVSTHSPYLIDYHCSFSFVTLFKLHPYHGAYIDLIW